MVHCNWSVVAQTDALRFDIYISLLITCTEHFSHLSAQPVDGHGMLVQQCAKCIISTALEKQQIAGGEEEKNKQSAGGAD